MSAWVESRPTGRLSITTSYRESPPRAARKLRRPKDIPTAGDGTGLDGVLVACKYHLSAREQN